MATALNPQRLVELEAACAAHASEARRWTIKLRRQSPALKLATLEVCLGYDLPTLTRLLLADGVPLSSRFDDGETVLHIAAECNALRVLRLLLDAGADTDAKDELGWTALHNAAHFGHLEVATLLLDAHAQINATDNKAWTAIMQAAAEGHASACELLASRGADLLAVSAYGLTAIHRAAFRGHADVVKALLPHLRRLGNVDLPTLLSQLPEDKDHVYGHTALHFACTKGHHLVAKRLLAAGASRTSTNSMGSTPLHFAAQYGHLACLTLVMGHPGAYQLSNSELDNQSTDGMTPLYLAASNGHPACCAALIAAGADPTKAANDGFTPLSVAKYYHADKSQLDCAAEGAQRRKCEHAAGAALRGLRQAVDGGAARTAAGLRRVSGRIFLRPRVRAKGLDERAPCGVLAHHCGQGGAGFVAVERISLSSSIAAGLSL